MDSRVEYIKSICAIHRKHGAEGWSQTAVSLSDIEYLLHVIQSDTVLKEDLRKQNDELRANNLRLRKGDFTPEEFQALCHNLSQENAEAFKKGCEEYQKKLFGEIVKETETEKDLRQNIRDSLDFLGVKTEDK